jgi:hypothetical protein
MRFRKIDAWRAARLYAKGYARSIRGSHFKVLLSPVVTISRSTMAAQLNLAGAQRADFAGALVKLDRSG